MGSRLGIMADSTADFPEGMVKKLKINLIPIHILVDGKDYLHGVDISNEEVIEYMKEEREVKTFPPLPSEYSDFYEKIANRYDHIISFHVSSDLSNSFKSATNSIKVLFDDIPDKITHVDTRNVSAGQALLIKKAVELKDKFRSPKDIVLHLEPFIKNNIILFTVDNLYWLKRSGKLNFFSSLMGNILDFKPIIGLKNGKLISIAKHRGRWTAIEDMIRLTREEYKKFDSKVDIWIAHADARKDAIKIHEALRTVSAGMKSKIYIAEIGPTIAAHTGPGGLCIAMMPR